MSNICTECYISYPVLNVGSICDICQNFTALKVCTRRDNIKDAKLILRNHFGDIPDGNAIVFYLIARYNIEQLADKMKSGKIAAQISE